MGNEAELSTLACVLIGVGIVVLMDLIGWMLAVMDVRSKRRD